MYSWIFFNFERVVVPNIYKSAKKVFLMNIFTVKYPHEINPERCLVRKYFIAVLFYQITLPQD